MRKIDSRQILNFTCLGPGLLGRVMATELSEYERQRLQTIEENKKLFNSLHLPAAFNDVAPKKPPPKSKPAKSRASGGSASKKKARDESSLPPRRESKRLKGIVADAAATEKMRKEEEEERARAEEEEILAKHADRSLDILSSTGNNLDTSSDYPSESLRRAFKALPDTTVVSSKSSSTMPDPDIESLKTTFQSLRLKSLTKLVPERVYSMAVHENPLKDLIFVGDKVGHLGIFDATVEARREYDDSEGEAEDEDMDKDKKKNAKRTASTAKREDDEEEEKQKVTWTIKPHTRGSISQVKMDPSSSHSLYTASYDCTLRYVNFETGVSTEILDVDKIAEEYEYSGNSLLSSFDFTGPSGREIWLSDNRGGLTHKDVRERNGLVRRWRISPTKVGCVSVNPQYPHYLVTAQLTREMNIWDARKIQTYTQETEPSEIIENAKLGSFTHGYSCSSAYWDPSGTHIVTTSYDDTCRVWNLDLSDRNPNQPFSDSELKPDVAIKHNNQTGRYVSVLKAQWSRKQGTPAHFTIGNMNHSLDVIAYDGTLLAQLYDPEYITAVPAVTANHPSITGRAYGATASGKISVFAP